MKIVELRSAEGLSLRLMDVGATWLSCRVPTERGALREVLLGCATLDDYRAQTAYLGATVGRYANRIREGRLARAGQHWNIALPEGKRHALHGGPGGFHAQTWTVAAHSREEAVFTLDSPDGDQGFPGRMLVQVAYRVSDGRTIEMVAEARCDRPCPVAITQHAYWNLDAQPGDVREHRLQLRAARVMPVDAELIPSGPPVDTDGTGFDFRVRKRIAEDWLADDQQRQAGGYDHAFLLDVATADQPAARLWASDGSLALNLVTDAPALQVYTGQYLAGTPRREGGAYAACAGIALEPGWLPDSPNHPEWPQPDCWVSPGQVWRQVTRWSFGPG